MYHSFREKKMTSPFLEPDPSPLCCCEYHNRDGERSHLLALCCDCEALDQAVDRMVSGREVKSGMVGEIIDVIEERMRFPWRHGAVKFPIGKVVPMIMLPSMLWLATLHPYLGGVHLPPVDASCNPYTISSPMHFT